MRYRNWARSAVTAVLVLSGLSLGLIRPALATDELHVSFKRVRTQFIAALGDPGATAGNGAQHWGVWRKDPGPRGVWLRDFESLQQADGRAPANWQFDPADWWLDENGLLMEKPDFPLPPGHYLVTGDREVTTVLTIHPTDNDGNRRWQLHNGARLHDVTHMPCRSARYRPGADAKAASCSPGRAALSDFKVKPGASMPEVPGCQKQDYAVLFIIGVAVSP